MADSFEKFKSSLPSNYLKLTGFDIWMLKVLKVKEESGSKIFKYLLISGDESIASNLQKKKLSK